eukprot:m.34565 g.34565  ORF g.34565 m.34565 type:complete len:201 (+) comp15512_c0_seq1:2-604(+)
MLLRSLPTSLWSGSATVRLLHTSSVTHHFFKYAIWKQEAAQKAGKKVKEYPKDVYYGCRRAIPVSPWKLNLLAKQIRGLPVEEAKLQMEFSHKKAASQILQVLKITQRNAEFHNGLENPTDLHVYQSWTTKGKITKHIRYHGRGQAGRVTRPHAHYFLMLRRGPPPDKRRKKEDHPIFKTRKLRQDALVKLKKIRNSLED